jgi:hypothetical protein
MMPMQRMVQVLGAAIVLIVLSLAPSVARAHVGHQHHASDHAAHGQAASHAASHESDSAATPASLQQAQGTQNGSLPASERNCVGGCCSFACAACCVAALPGPVGFMAFLPSITRVAFAPSRIGPDREPESLRRPPKSLI